MNSSSFFRTENGNCYLYDINRQQLINVHPVFETINQLANETNDISESLRGKHPELTDTEVVFYLKKYDYLKECGLFSDFDFNGIFTSQISAKQIENQITHLDVITFQVTGNCNLNCRYCCYGELYDNNYKVTRHMDFEKFTIQNHLDTNNIFYIVKTDLIIRFEYYLEQIPFTSKALIDQGNLFFKCNPAISQDSRILLLNNKNEPIFIGNNFTEKTKSKLLKTINRINHEKSN